ncbi:MAG: protein kinase [Polyangiales bacterium]
MVGRQLGRYEVLTRLASGGMAEVYIARAIGVAGFERLVALKVLHGNLAHEREFITMFLDEARLAARIRHPNVVPTLDVRDSGGDGFFLVMDYVEGGHLGTLIGTEAQQHRRLPVDVVARIAMDALAGLAAAHTLHDDAGQPLNLVHRDVSPHNLLVGADGICRLTDFGVAKAEIRLSSTRTGQFKGKLGYMAPEQAATGTTDQRSDLFSMGIILWEALSGCRLFRGRNNVETLTKILNEPIPAPSSRAPELAPFDALLAHALQRDPARRFQSADAFIEALESVIRPLGGAASSRLVAQHVARILGPGLDAQRAALKAATEALGRARLDGEFMPAPRGSQPGTPPRPPERESLTPALDPALGEVVDGRYRLDMVLGQGGHGVVYGATHTTLRRRVALKALRADLSGCPEAASRFEQEARSVCSLGHPNIVDIIDFGHLPDGRSYFVMEHLDGQTLRARLRQGALATPEAIQVAGQVASALSAAHGQRVIHRDLKPENIFLQAPQGGLPAEAKVLDFGVAKVASAPHSTDENVVFGSPHYMSPEQAAGDSVDGRTDVYALGIILYEMLTGVAPFRGDSFVHVLHQHVHAPPPGHPRLTRDEPVLGNIILRALAKDREQRYPDMNALLADLPQLERPSHISGVDLVAARVTPAVAAPPAAAAPTKSRWRTMAWVGASVVALGLLATLGVVALRTLGPEAQAASRGASESMVPTSGSPGAPDAPAPESAPPGGASVAALPAPTPNAAPGADANAGSTANTPAPAGASAHVVQIHSDPPGAMVEQDGALIGNTPLPFHLPSGHVEARLTLTLAGHRSAVVAVSGNSPERIDVTLAPSSGSSSSRSSRHGEAASPASAPSAQAPAPSPPPTSPAPRPSPAVSVDVVDPWNQGRR